MAALAHLVALGLQAVVIASEPPSTPRSCPGPSLAMVESELGPADRFAIDAAMQAPFLQLWDRVQRRPLPIEPDSVTVLARPDRPLVIVFARVGCALGVLQASRPDVFQALRAGIGPAV